MVLSRARESRTSRFVKRFARRRQVDAGDVFRGLAAGLIGGLAGALAMDRYQAVLSRITRAVSKPKREQAPAHNAGEAAQEQEPTTVQVATIVSRKVLHRSLTRSQKQKAGTLVHYVFGSTMAAMYGALAEVRPRVTAGAGVPASTALWLGADELGLPALGLAKWPTSYPLSVHLYALTSHWVYGLTVEMVRRFVRRIL